MANRKRTKELTMIYKTLQKRTDNTMANRKRAKGQTMIYNSQKT